MTRLKFLSAEDLSRILLFLSSVYILVASTYVSISMGTFMIPRSIYYHFVLILLVLCSGLSLQKIRLKTISKKHQFYVFTTLSLSALIWWIYRKPLLFSDSLWFDEATQFMWEISGSIVRFAASQQQPPIDYFLSKFAKFTLGISEFSVLIHAVSFGILAYIVFTLWLILVRVPFLLIPIALLLFANQHVLLRYSTEARPISLAIFFALLTLIFIYESYKRAKIQILPLFSSAMLLLLSTGLQPMLFVVLVALSFLPLLWSRTHNGKVLIRFGLTVCIVPLILFLPFLWLIYVESEVRAQFHPGSYWEKWINAFMAISDYDFAIYRKSVSEAHWLFLIPFAILLATLALKYFKFMISRMAVPSAFALLFFSFSFPFFFQIFWTIINWQNIPHYFVLWPVGVFALSFMALAHFFKPYLSSNSLSEFKIGTLSVLTFMAVFFGERVINRFAPAHYSRVLHEYAGRPDWRAVAALAQDTSIQAIFIEIPYIVPDPMGIGIYNYLTGLIYAKPNHIVPTLTNYSKSDLHPPVFSTYRISFHLSRHEKPSDLYFLLRYRESDYEDFAPLIEYLTPFVDEVYKDIRGYIVFKMSNQDSPIASTQLIYSKAIESAPLDPRSFYIQEALLTEYINQPNKKEALKILPRLKILLLDNPIKDNPEFHEYLKKIEERVKSL